MAAALLAVPDYEYYDYSPTVVSFAVDDINAEPKARDTFATMSLHMLVHKQHLLGIVELYALRDTTSEPDLTALSSMILDLHHWPMLGSKSTAITVGSMTAIDQSGSDYSLTLWVNKGVLYTVWDYTMDGNSAYVHDYAAAALATAQGMPVPEPTITKTPSTKYIGPEDADLIARMPVYEDFFYMDVPYEMAVAFYKSFNGRTDLERGSIHYLIHGGDIADDDDASLMGYLMLLELKDPLKGNKAKITALVKTLTQGVAKDEDRFAVTEANVGSTTLWIVDHYDETGFSQAYVWDYQGVVYLFDTNGECYDTCAEDLMNYVEQLVTTSATP